MLGQPAAPSGVVATPVSSTAIGLTWIDNSTNETGFRIQQSMDGIAFTSVATNDIGGTNFTVFGLRPAIKYYFRIIAFNGGGNSGPSNTNSAVTLTPWQQWQENIFTSEQISNQSIGGMNADPDGDGLPNLTEYAMHRNAWVSDAESLSTATVVADGTNNYLALNWTANSAALDVAFRTELSTDLQAWTLGSDLVIGPTPMATNGDLVTEQFVVRGLLSTASAQFMKLTIAYNGVPNSWTTGLTMPTNLIELASVWIGDKLYNTGMNNPWNPVSSSPMMVYDGTSNFWKRLVPDRPYTGNHHAAETFEGKLYIIGGLDAGQGRVQIYDPATNGWSLGASMPYPAGACATATINGKIYVAGGIVGEVAGSNVGYTTNAAAVYDPASNVWTTLPPEPYPLNHAAYGTDGTNFYLFGGRAVGNKPDLGSDTVQIYYPSSNTWLTSADPGSTIAPLPQARASMGRACYYNGNFYVMGGETASGGTGATADRVYNRVDIYNVASNTWSLGTPIPVPDHSICGALRGNRIYVCGGGMLSGTSEALNPATFPAEMFIYILPPTP